MAWVEHDYADSGSLAAMLVQELQSACEEAIALRGKAVLALAGGATPLPVYRRLAAQPLCWAQVVVLPTDERCVPHDHPACNLRQIRDAFADAPSVQVEEVTPRDGDADRAEACAQAVMARYPGPFDAVVLGMGLDAHTASLFPGARCLGPALDPDSDVDACRIDPLPLPPEAPYPRVTLTVARLLRARTIHLVVTGIAKREVLRQAQAAHDPKRRPVAAVLHASGALVHIHWSP